MEIDIRHIAKLARLKVDDKEAARFEAQMKDIIAMVEQMPALTGDYADLDPARPMELRCDEVQPSTRREELLKNAPAVQAGCVVVPKTVE